MFQIIAGIVTASGAGRNKEMRDYETERKINKNVEGEGKTRKPR